MSLQDKALRVIYTEAKKLEISNFLPINMLAGHAQNHERASGCLSEERRKNMAIQSDNSMQRIQHAWQGWDAKHLISVFEFAASAMCCRCGSYEIRPSIFKNGKFSRYQEHRRGICNIHRTEQVSSRSRVRHTIPFLSFVQLSCLEKMSRHTQVK